MPSRLDFGAVNAAALRDLPALPDLALALAEQGTPSFPVLSNKAPACPTGFKAATRDPLTLRDLWRRHPGALVGVPTGEVSGLDVLDLDLPRHAEACKWWRTNKHRIPPTRAHESRSGGLHLLFRAAPRLRCSAGKIASGVDVRATGGFIIWWPAAGCRVLRALDPAPWPNWLLAELQPPPPSPLRPITLPAGSNAARRYALGAVRRAVERVASAGKGTRNDRLNAEAFSLTRLCAEGALTEGELAEALAHAGLAAGLTTQEVQATLASALRAGGAA